MSTATCELNGPNPGYDAPIPEPADDTEYATARSWLLEGPDSIIKVAEDLYLHRYCKTVDLGQLLQQCHLTNSAPDGIEEIVIVDVEDLARRWIDHIGGMATTHDHDAYSRLDEQGDELLIPLLTAPMDQLREFAAVVSRGLREDSRVPFGVWSTYEHVIAGMVEKLPDGAEIQLRTDLAQEIAAQVATVIDRASFIDSIAGALKWRDPKALEAVKKALGVNSATKGGKVRMSGGQSCTYLTIEAEDGMELAKVVL